MTTRCGNMASIMTVHEDGSRTFTVYGAAEENTTKGKIGGLDVTRRVRIRISSSCPALSRIPGFLHVLVERDELGLLTDIFSFVS